MPPHRLPPPPTAPAAPAAAEAPAEEIGEGLIGGTTSTGRTAVLVGYGVKQTEAKRRPRSGSLPAKVEAPDLSAEGTDVAIEPVEIDAEGLTLTGERARALAKPPVRKLAKDLGIDLGSVTPTGEGGTVTRADVEAAASGAGAAASDDMAPAASRWGLMGDDGASGRPGSRSRACAR